MSQTGQKIITVHILYIISSSKGKQTIWSETFFLKAHIQNKVSILVPDPFCFLKKLYIKQKQVASTLVLTCFGRHYSDMQ